MYTNIITNTKRKQAALIVIIKLLHLTIKEDVMSYKSLVNSYAVTLVIQGKESSDCIDCLNPTAHAELKAAYLEQLSDYDKADLMQAVIENLDINPALLIATGKLTADNVKAIRNEFDNEVMYYINHDLHEAYINALSDKKQHVAEYRADWEEAA